MQGKGERVDGGGWMGGVWKRGHGRNGRCGGCRACVGGSGPRLMQACVDAGAGERTRPGGREAWGGGGRGGHSQRGGRRERAVGTALPGHRGCMKAPAWGRGRLWPGVRASAEMRHLRCAPKANSRATHTPPGKHYPTPSTPNSHPPPPAHARARTHTLPRAGTAHATDVPAGPSPCRRARPPPTRW